MNKQFQLGHPVHDTSFQRNRFAAQAGGTFPLSGKDFSDPTLSFRKLRA
jgi:hypothetical protein